ncbi:phosphoglucosamine mutase [Vreelandella aquamarina]|jgi:phosphoglucosamine mutase|uniref:Phosphoglucosamine mutase n=1 Tax=Vreelandella aquamarina TaxID=77097 RepID=A0A6F8XDZ5_9GAMM|nr:phosphoglucosamine mutase [Halomonas meridiana]MEC9306369.1 phosphoglucosamine mutase [Pseudomonadota bacterium]BCB72412.1 phosphoglucosamine mutase [Halomonas meridiana]HBQ07344.1 phosphoglucosamine mutase [Halomonas sp.]HBS17754.1 phosphoglucosamine mutase [Halomonas sp.]|tara:strand:+ start:882 stop:2231 length:1350 start_codon:yes stop_codon:yes gene_type:complete
MTRRYFGTDGIRGTVGQAPITADFMLKLGWAAGQVLRREKGRTRVLIGKDTRISGYMFESALEAGLSAAGVDVSLLGPMPTPGIAYLTRTFRADAGIVISASHNPFDDNGIKFFSAEGKKLPDDVEGRIEAMLEAPLTTADAAQLGKAARIDDAAGRYIEFCKSTLPDRLSLHGLKVVLDCAHGATYHIAPSVFRELGAEVSVIGAAPDGLNINHHVGSTHPAALRAAVIQQGADLGIAFDGDGDRVLLVDADGREVDGDDILYLIARDRFERGLLEGGVVGTLMSNFGLGMALDRLGIPFQRAKVGDRFVMEMMAANGWELGGEASGHIVCGHVQTTGDGIVSALQVLGLMVREQKPLPSLLKGLEKVPQSLVNVRLPAGSNAKEVMAAQPLLDAVAALEAELGDQGRVLLRPSGTEPLIRVMVEGRAHLDVDRLANKLAGQVQALLG